MCCCLAHLAVLTRCVHMQISTNIDYISIMPAAVNTSLGYTAIYGAHMGSQFFLLARRY